MRETALVGLIKCIGDARVAQAAATATHGSGDVHSDTGRSQITRPTEGDGDDGDDEERDIGPEPESKIARLSP